MKSLNYICEFGRILFGRFVAVVAFLGSLIFFESGISAPADHWQPIGHVVHIGRASPSEGVNTNAFFLFDESNYRSHFDARDGLSLLDYCRTAVECGPAHLDSGGNWGFAAEGVQLSVRLAKTNYFVGENVRAEIILRNNSSNYWQTGNYNPLSESAHDEFDIRVRRNRIALKQNVPPVIVRGTSAIGGIYGRHQTKHVRNLAAEFDMSEPGEYLVFVERKLYKRSGKGTTSVRSGNAIIHVVAGGANSQFAGDRAIPTGDENLGIGAMADNTASSLLKSSPQSQLSAAPSREALSSDADSASVQMGQSAEFIGKSAVPLNEEIVTQNGYGGIALLFLFLAGVTGFLFFRRGR